MLIYSWADGILFIIFMNRLTGQPPIHAKKGIKVMQTHPIAVQNTKSGEWTQSKHYGSESGSVRSSRSRGISMSRESGINLDRIYQAKHFLPPKPNDKRPPSRSKQGQNRTIISCKSLEFIRLQQSATSKSHQTNSLQDLQSIKQVRGNVNTQKVQSQTHIINASIQKPVDAIKNKLNKPEVQNHLHPNIINF